MKRADRLLALIQILRRHRYPVTAAALACELGVSERTLYRDIVSLQGGGAPVRGEAGIGYVLDAGYDLPPLMFTPDELEALMLGARFAQRQGDATLARAAEDAVAKIEAVLPRELRPVFAESPLFAPSFRSTPLESIDVAQVRRAIREGRKLDVGYADEQGRASQRRIWPIAIGYFDAARIVIAWCELRRDFRHFRADRISSLGVSQDRIPEPRRRLLARWQQQRSDCAGRQTSGDTSAAVGD